MSINVNVGNIIPTNVVEVGNEISADQLAAITAANSPSGINPFSTASHIHTIANISGLQTALDGKSVVGHSHLIANITGLESALDGKSGTGHTHEISGITGLLDALDGKASTTHIHTGYALLTGATFSGEIEAPQIGNILNTDLVIDSYNDTGSGTHYYHKFTPFDGKFVLAPNGGGLVFPDATIQSTSSYSKAQSDANMSTVAGWLATKSDVGHTHIIANVTGLQTALDNKLTAPQNWTEGFDIARIFTISSGVLTWDGSTTISHPVTGPSAGTFVFNKKITCTPVSGVAGINIGIGGNSVDSTTAGDVYINTGSATLGFRDALGNAKLVACLTNGNAFTAVQSIDVSTTTPALRVTQRGTGNAFVVEDSTTPDSTAFIIDQYGKVGVGVAPDATAAIRVDSNGIKFSSEVGRQTEPFNITTRQKYADSTWLAHNFINWVTSFSIVDGNTRVWYNSNEVVMEHVSIYGTPTGGLKIKTNSATFICLGGGAEDGNLYIDFQGNCTGEFFTFLVNDIYLLGSGAIYIP
jgi:hypothetical protein